MNGTYFAETKKYFASISQRLAVKLPISHRLTIMLTGHGRMKAYFYRFHITQDTACPSNGGD